MADHELLPRRFLTSADIVAIHTAIHTMGKNDTVSTSFGDLLIGKTAWGAGVVNLPGSTATMMGCNPTKDSRFGRKAKAGGAVTFILPTKSFKPPYVVIESKTAVSAPTVASGQNFKLAGLIDAAQVRSEMELGTAGGLNIEDATRMHDDAELKERFPPKQMPGDDEINLIEIAKSDRAACKKCKEKMPKGVGT